MVSEQSRVYPNFFLSSLVPLFFFAITLQRHTLFLYNFFFLGFLIFIMLRLNSRENTQDPHSTLLCINTLSVIKLITNLNYLKWSKQVWAFLEAHELSNISLNSQTLLLQKRLHVH